MRMLISLLMNAQEQNQLLCREIGGISHWMFKLGANR